MSHEAGRLVGRESVVGVLRSTVASAASGRGRLLLVTGEAGIGKTALLAELAEGAALDPDAGGIGALVLWGQCWDGDGAPAYWPWAQVLRAGIAAGGDPGDAALLLPEHVPRASSPSIGQVDRFRLFDATVTFLNGLTAEQRPVLVALDDLHWADEGSLRLLEFASRHVASHPVLLLGAYRDEEASEPLLRVARGHETVNLSGLTCTDVATLVATLTGTAQPPSMVADVWRRTGGNPFLVRELTRLLVAQGGHRQESTPPLELLDRVRDILERRLARLSQHCVELLTLAAVIGPDARLDLLVRVAAEATDVPGLLDEAVGARVLASPPSPSGPYRFSHDLFRETLLLAEPADRRTLLHLTIGRALEDLRDEGAPVHPAELAAHFGAARSVAPAQAVRYGILAAADATARLAFEEARGHYERALAALDLAPEHGPADRLDVMLRLGEARNRAGDAAAAHHAFRDAAELARRQADSIVLARAAIGIHELGWRHRHGEAITILSGAVAALPETPSALRARVLAALARDLHHSIDDEQDWERTLALATEAVDNARRAGDPSTLAFCLLALHDAHWRPGTARERLPVVDDMLAAADDAGDRDMAAQARLLRAAALIELGEPEGPVELDAYCRLCDALGHARARYGALTRRATAAVIAGDLTRAEELAVEGFAFGQAIGEQDARGVYETLMWAVKRAGGSWHVIDIAADPGSLASDPWPGLPLLEAAQHVANGDLPAARHALDRLRLDELPRTYDLEMLTFAAEAAAATGSADQRTRLLEMLVPHAGSHIVVGGCAAYYGAVDHYLGLLARSLGQTEDAQRHFTSAAALHDRLGAGGWAEHSRKESAACRPETIVQPCVFRRDGEVWTIAYQGTEAHLPDAKGMRDLAVLLARPGESVHAVQLHTGHPPQTGADEILDDQTKRAYRARLAELESGIDEAEADNDTHRAERARAERDMLIRELSAAVGLGGRDRRLGDERERARKAVTARIRDAIARIERVNPELAKHLRDTVQTGTWCIYTPSESSDGPDQAEGSPAITSPRRRARRGGRWNG